MRNEAWPPMMAGIAARGAITADDVGMLRASVYGNGTISVAEAGWLIALDEAAGETCDAWAALFVEALTDHLVWQQAPEGYISEDNAAWLVQAIGRDGVVKTATEIELLVKLLEAARSAPASLSAFALRQVSAAVLDGSGPLCKGGRLQEGVIGRDEVELLRRILFAFGSHGAIGISREEVEVLFDLNDRSVEAANDPSWSDLFVKATANFLMAARGYAVPTREEALRREAWLDAPGGGVSAVFGGMMSGLLADGLKGIWSRLRQEPTEQALRNKAVEEETRLAEIVNAEEIRWLADRIGRDGVIHENERALLAFLRDESPDLHPSLRTLLDTAA